MEITHFKVEAVKLILKYLEIHWEFHKFAILCIFWRASKQPNLVLLAFFILKETHFNRFEFTLKRVFSKTKNANKTKFGCLDALQKIHGTANLWNRQWTSRYFKQSPITLTLKWFISTRIWLFVSRFTYPNSSPGGVQGVSCRFVNESCQTQWWFSEKLSF